MHGMVDWAGRMKQMAEFVGLTQTDLGLIQSTAAVLVPMPRRLPPRFTTTSCFFRKPENFFCGRTARWSRTGSPAANTP